MAIDGAAPGQGIPANLSLAEAYGALDDKRRDIDRRISSLASDDPARDLLWQELEAAIAKLRELVIGLANTQATRLPELRAKAHILGTLLRAGDDGDGPLIPEHERSALALSLTEDIARLTIG